MLLPIGARRFARRNDHTYHAIQKLRVGATNADGAKLRLKENAVGLLHFLLRGRNNFLIHREPTFPIS